MTSDLWAAIAALLIGVMLGFCLAASTLEKGIINGRNVTCLSSDFKEAP